MADYKNIVPFIKKFEGGLSKSPYDTAKDNPSPCRYKREMGWHTNKGIQWIVFKENAGSLGYDASCNNFLAMPDDIWLKIYKNKYWDRFYLDTMKSQPIANVIVTWAWGSGVGGGYSQLAKFINKTYGQSYSTSYSAANAKTLVLFLDEKAKQVGEKKLFEQLVEWRKNYFISLNQPANLNGWLKRLDEFKKLHTEFLTKSMAFVKQNWLPITIGSAIVVSIIIYAARKNNNNG